MEDLKHLIKIAGPKMLPFVNAVGLYFALGAHETNGEYWSTIMKCAPIVSLIVFMLLHGNEMPKRTTYAHNILLGLVFSCVGDALLNHGHFAGGMGAFSVTQIFYIIAFHSHTTRLWIAGLLYAGGLFTIYVLHKQLESVILIGLPVYTFLLLTMCWRSIARASDPKYSMQWLPTFSAMGSVLFVISDSLIAFDRFHAPIAYSSILIMLTYYAAQFVITLSIVQLPSIETPENQGISTTCNDGANASKLRSAKID